MLSGATLENIDVRVRAYIKSQVSGTLYLGGLIGYSNGSSLTNCIFGKDSSGHLYSDASIFDTSYVEGFIAILSVE